MQFSEWLNSSGSVKCFCYLRVSKSGQLSIWREDFRIGKKLTDEAIEAIYVGKQAVDAYLAGRVNLFQRRGSDGFEYIAIKRLGSPPEFFEQMRWKEWEKSQKAPIKKRERERERQEQSQETT